MRLDLDQVQPHTAQKFRAVRCAALTGVQGQGRSQRIALLSAADLKSE